MKWFSNLLSMVTKEGRRRRAGVLSVKGTRSPEDDLRDHFQIHRNCPDCGSKSFLEGPSGGMSTNMKCAGCDSEFNISMWVGDIMFVERI